MEYFDYRGRDYRIFKRTNSETAPWQFEMMRHGKRFATSLRTNDNKVAIKQAKALLEGADKDKLEAVRAVLSPRAPVEQQFCTIDQLLAEFEIVPIKIGKKHRQDVAYSLGRILREVHGPNYGTMSAGILNEETAAKYFAAILKHCEKKPDKEQARMQRTANSTWCQAVCALRPAVMLAYKRAGLQVPDVEPFRNCYKAMKFTGITARYDPPRDEIVRKTLHEWVHLENRNMFLAIGLALSCGLRKGETAQVTWDMFTWAGKHALLDGHGHVKNHSGTFRVIPIDPFWTVLIHRIEREGWRGQPHELVLQGSQTEVTDSIFRDVGCWLREMGWKLQKTNHALRAFAGSQVAMKWDIFRASMWLRHSSVKVTQQRYSHFIKERIFDPAKVYIRWARKK